MDNWKKILDYLLENRDVIITTIGGVAAALGISVKKDREKKKAVAETAELTKDQEQDKALKEHNVLIKSHNQFIEEVREQLEKQEVQMTVLAETIQHFKKRNDKNDEVEEFKNKIQSVGHSIIESYEEQLDNSTRAMILEGCEKSADLFGDVLKKNVKHVDMRIFKSRATSALRSIRAQYSGDTHVSKKLASDIKTKVAYPALEALLAEITILRTGKFNGSTDSRYKALVIDFIKKFILDAVNLINKHNEANNTDK